MAIPPDIKARLDQLRAQAQLKAQLQQQYEAAMAGRYTKDMIPFSQWLSQRQPGMAKGGVAHLAIGGQGPRNFLKGTVEKVIEPLKVQGDFDQPEMYLKASQNPKISPSTKAQLEEAYKDALHHHSVNKWIESNLGNYIRKNLGHPNDPLRKLAERGVLHINPDTVFEEQETAKQAESRRQMMGGQKMAEGPLAQAWENAVDSMFELNTVEDVRNMPDIYKGMHEPWMDKADPKTQLYELYGANELGFDHIVDVLKQDLAEGRIRPEQLSKVSIEQAVRRVHEYNQERAKAMREAQLKQTEGMPVHKDYGDGFKWVELKAPELKELPEGYQVNYTSQNLPYLVNPEGVNVGYFEEGAGQAGALRLISEDRLQNALKYEGDTMGHCVGGYCPDVAEGRSRIFSLRDAKNEPHVTIEVQPHPLKTWDHVTEAVGPEKAGQLWKEFDQMHGYNSNVPEQAFDEFIKSKGIEQPMSIRQIKGKQNAKPKAPYIPYVQDFVKSGNWVRIDDFKNTDLRDIHKTPALRGWLADNGIQTGRYVTEDEYAKHEGNMLLDKLSVQGKAKGGEVKAPNLDTMRLALTKFLKQSKVKERVYHGTGNLENLASFDPGMTGKGNDQLGSGFYFTTHPDEASGYATSVTLNVGEGTPKLGGNNSPGVVAAHLAIRKPIKIGPKGYGLHDSNVNLSHDQVKRIMEHNPKLRDPEESPLNDHFDTSRGVTPKMIHDVAGYYTGKGTLHMLENDMFSGDPTGYRHALHNVLGYDGVIKDFGNGRKHYVAWFPEQVKSAIGNRGTYDTTNPDITMAKGGTVQPGIAQMKLALNKQGMYSPLEKAAMAVPRTKGTPAEFMAEASKQPGFRKEEVADRKISLPDQKMTKEEFLGHLGKHASPQITEVTLSDKLYKKHLDDLAEEYMGEQGVEFDDLWPVQQQDIYAMSQQRGRKYKEPQYGDYALPGGENYREVLLKLPQQGLTDKERDQMFYIEANKRRGEISAQQEEILQKLKAKEAAASKDYMSQHWKDDPNVVAHLRLSDRKGPNGEKLLHIEEIQSDWHQEGRKKGYASSDAEEKLKEGEQRMAQRDEQIRQLSNRMASLNDSQLDEFNALADERQRLQDLQAQEMDWGNSIYDAQRSGVPDAPFKNSWHELALKHALGMAAKGGYHGIAITPGEEQANRYDLSKHLNEINYGKNPDGTYSLTAVDKNGKTALHEKSISESQLESMVGKEMAQKIAGGEGDEFPAGSVSEGMKSLSGLDLKVGGEGMKGFYDKIVPTYLNKLGKPHGAQVSQITVDTNPKVLRIPGDQQPANLHYFPITDSMRQQIKTEGLPQYQRGGKVKGLDHFFESDNSLDHFFQE